MFQRVLLKGGRGHQLAGAAAEAGLLVRALTPSFSLHLVITFGSRSSSYRTEQEMYTPFADALNHALEPLSDIQVDGLLEFKAHIMFMPCDMTVASNRDSQGSLFKPDVVIMSLEDTRELHKLDKLDTPKVSEFIDKIMGTSCGCVGWNTMLSVVELKRKGSSWSALQGSGSQDSAMQDTDQPLDVEPDTSEPVTCKIDIFLYEHLLTRAG